MKATRKASDTGPTPRAWAMNVSRSRPVIRDSRVANPVVVVFFNRGRLIALGAYQSQDYSARSAPG